ncbi:MAG: hypothetical protein JSR98_16165 [Proteobacteria bacterium]|nr:hypothetical protein [Pseudomonadota bacterium]
MTLKTLALAGATLVSLAAPATVMAQPYYGYDYGYHRDHDRDRYDRGDYDRDAWRRNEWRAYDRYEHRGDYRDYRRCYTEQRGGYYAWNGRYVPRTVEVCR